MFEVSVVIPTHNRLKFLHESVESVRSQSYPVKQIIVVDDGSTDETEQWCRIQSDISYLKTEQIGPSGARNFGARVASSQWIAFLDSDDVWCSNHIEILMNVVLKYSNISWVISNSIITDPDLKPLTGVQGFSRAFPVFKMSELRFESFFPDSKSSACWSGNAQRQALMGNWLQPSGLLVQKEFFLSLNGFKPSLKRCEDMDLLLRMTLISNATVSILPTYMWRQGQADSLAADKYSLLLKLGALMVLRDSGFCHVRKRPSLVFVWVMSYLKHVSDFFISSLLRMIKKTKIELWLQTILLSCAAFLNIFLPIFLSRSFSQNDFGEYRTFGIYLATSTALSFTSGFWSLLPYWRTHNDQGFAPCAVAFKLTIVFSGLFAILIYFVSPFSVQADSLLKTLLLSFSIFFLIPAFFLEQSLNFAGQGLRAAIIIAAAEFAKVGSIIFFTMFIDSILSVFFIVWLFLVIRLCILYRMNFKQGLVRIRGSYLCELGPVLKSAGPVSLAAAVLAFAGSFDRFYLSKQIAVNDFAVIAAGCISIPFVGFFEQSVYQRAISQIALMLQNHRFEDAIDILKKASIKVACISLPFTFLVVVFADDIISFLFDERYVAAGLVLKIFALQNLTSCLPVDILSRAQGKSCEILVFSIFQLLLVLVLVSVGFRFFGAIGVVSCAVTSNILSRVCFLFWKFRFGGSLKF